MAHYTGGVAKSAQYRRVYIAGLLGEVHFCGRCGQLLIWCRDQLGKPVASSQSVSIGGEFGGRIWRRDLVVGY